MTHTEQREDRRRILLVPNVWRPDIIATVSQVVQA